MVARRKGGFTLIEAMVALTISSLIVVLVSTVFLVQNEFYAIQLSRSQAHDNARTMTEFMASEVRSTMEGGIVTARSDSLVVRSPIVLAAVCAQGRGHRAVVQFSGGQAGVDTTEISGVALRDASTGNWTYHDAVFRAFHPRGGGGSPAADCADNGADTLGVTGDFQEFIRLNVYFSHDPPNGSVLMLYRKVTYSIRTSTMDPSVLALYRTVAGLTPVEFATGIDSSAGFQYRTGGSVYANSVSGGSVGDIDAIRIVAEARTRPRAGGVDDVNFGWAVNIILRNVH